MSRAGILRHAYSWEMKDFSDGLTLGLELPNNLEKPFRGTPLSEMVSPYLPFFPVSFV